MPLSLAILRPRPLATRLWQGGGLAAAVILAIVAMNFVVPEDQSVGRRMLGHDFLAFYTAGGLVRDGQADQLYNLETTRRVQAEIRAEHHLDLPEGFGPYWNPPFYALVFVPFSKLPYPAAVSAWVTLNVLFAAGAILLLCRMVAQSAAAWSGFNIRTAPAWRYWLLVPILVCFSMPFLQAISHGQNTFGSLLLLTITVTLWRNRSAVAAGMVCGLLFYKPQLAMVVAAMMTITLGWRALAGPVFGGVAPLFGDEVLLPGSLRTYLHQLPLNLALMQVESSYLWERHATLRSFWRLLLQGRGPGEMAEPAMIAWTATAGLVALGLLAAAWNTVRRPVDDIFAEPSRAAQRDRLIAAAIAAMPLLMPFYFDYDLLLLAIPFTLLAAERIRGGEAAQDRTLIKVAAMLFVWLMINPGVARASGINVTVLLVAAVAGLFIARACRTEAEHQAAPAGAARRGAVERVHPALGRVRPATA